MAAGEYISVQSQNESTHAELRASSGTSCATTPKPSWPNSPRCTSTRGVDRDVAAAGRAAAVPRSRSGAASIHAQEELGVDPQQLPSPWTAAGSSFASFSVGALIPLLPYLFGAHSLVVSVVLAALALFAAGAVSSRFTSRGAVFAGTRQLLIGVFAAAVTFGIGAIFHTTTAG